MTPAATKTLTKKEPAGQPASLNSLPPRHDATIATSRHYSRMAALLTATVGTAHCIVSAGHNTVIIDQRATRNRQTMRLVCVCF
jgi:hypothetical protein